MPPKTSAVVHGVRKTLLDEFVKWVIRIALTGLAALLVFLLTPLREQVTAIWRSPDVISQVQATQTAIIEQIGAIRDDIREATGEDRVIRQPPGQSYVEEPVSQGETVVMIMAVQRTTLGRECRLTDWVPLFTDAANVTIPGQRAQGGGVRRQIGDSLERLRIEMIPPSILRPGRIEVYLSLEYECAGETIIERSDVVSYQLLPRE